MPTSGTEKVPGMPEPESLVSRLGKEAATTLDWTEGDLPALLTEAANRIEELEARSSLLVEAAEWAEGRAAKMREAAAHMPYQSVGAAGDVARARALDEAAQFLRNLADRPSPEQTANSKSNPNQSKSWNSGEQDEVEVRLSLTADEQAALRHEFSEPYGRDMRLGIIGKLRTALEEEGR